MFIGALIFGELVSALCARPRVEVARGHLEVFLDPSPQKRSEVTVRLATTVVRRLAKDAKKKSCFEEVVSDLIDFAEPDRLPPGINVLHEANAAPKIQSPGSTLTSDPRKWDPREVARIVAAARTLALAKGREWPIEVTSDEKIIDAPTGGGVCEIIDLGTSARGALTGNSLPAGTPYVSWSLPPRDAAGEAEIAHEVRKLAPDLIPMGMIRAYDLIFETDIEGEFSAPSSTARPSLMQVPHVPSFDAIVSHFPREFEIYRAEWDAAHPRRAPISGLALSDRDEVGNPTVKGELRNWVLERDRYSARRWLETDKAAPHPDVQTIRAALKDMGAETTP